MLLKTLRIKALKVCSYAVESCFAGGLACATAVTFNDKNLRHFRGFFCLLFDDFRKDLPLHWLDINIGSKGGSLQISSTYRKNAQTCGITKFDRFADLPQVWQFVDLRFADPNFI